MLQGFAPRADPGEKPLPFFNTGRRLHSKRISRWWDTLFIEFAMNPRTNERSKSREP